MRTIVTNAFNFSKLSTITIPLGIKSIQRNTFYRCDNLTALNFEETMEEWNNIDLDLHWIDYKWELLSFDGLVHCSDGNIDLISLNDYFFTQNIRL